MSDTWQCSHLTKSWVSSSPAVQTLGTIGESLDVNTLVDRCYGYVVYFHWALGLGNRWGRQDDIRNLYPARWNGRNVNKAAVYIWRIGSLLPTLFRKYIAIFRKCDPCSSLGSSLHRPEARLCATTGVYRRKLLCDPEYFQIRLAQLWITARNATEGCCQRSFAADAYITICITVATKSAMMRKNEHLKLLDSMVYLYGNRQAQI